MKHVAWIGLGWLGVTFWTAIGSRVVVGHVLPDAAVITVSFLALRREPIEVALSALVLGYLVGRQAVAPLGLHEVALVVCAVATYSTSGRVAGSGPVFFGVIAGVAVMVFHLLLFGLLTIFRGPAAFASVSTAVLLPSAMATGLLAALSYPWMMRLDRWLSPEQREGLSWR